MLYVKNTYNPADFSGYSYPQVSDQVIDRRCDDRALIYVQ